MSFPNGHLNMQDKVHHTPGLGLDAGPNKDDPRDIFLRSKGKLHPIWLVVLASACVMHTQKDRYDNWIIKNAFTARTRPLNLHTSEIANLGLQGSQRKLWLKTCFNSCGIHLVIWRLQRLYGIRSATVWICSKNKEPLSTRWALFSKTTFNSRSISWVKHRKTSWPITLRLKSLKWPKSSRNLSN